VSCLCSWCVEARLRARADETTDLRDLAAYDHARTWDAYWDERFARDAERREAAARAAVETVRALHTEVAGARARAMREARERAGASCP
jgi:hypothetical protein